MDREGGLQVEHLDREISSFRTTLAQLPQTENGTFDFALLRQKRILENKIQQQRTFLHLLLQGQSRPWHFHRLPLEILVEIFQWVTDPADQLQLLRTFPILGPLMHWDESVLIFKQIYPLIGHYLWEDWRNLWKLGQVRREFMDVVLDHLKFVLSETFDHQYDRILEETDTEQMFVDLIEECDRLGRTEWMSNMPFLVWPHFRLEAAEPVDGTSVGRIPDYVNKFLDAHGEKVWICEISLSTSAALYSENEARAVITDIIRRTPNLVVLYCKGFEGLRHEPIPPAPRPWPRLPHLRYLKVTWSDHFITGLIRQYSAQLTVLASPGIPENGSRFPRLESYYTNFPNIAAVQDVFPQSILESPLKFLHLKLSRSDQTPGVLDTLAQLGNSLEVLKIYYTGRLGGTPLDFRIGIRLPKLRQLKIFWRVRELDWLLGLPSLQTLALSRLPNEISSGLLNLSKSPENGVSTNVWKYLQNLTRMDIEWMQFDQERWSLTKNRYTRVEYERRLLTGK